MIRKNIPISDEDAELFHEMIGGVKPLPQKKIDPDSAPVTDKRTISPKPPEQHSEFGELEYAPMVAADEPLSFARSGVQHKVITKLKKGQINIEAKIDLHGYSVNGAGVKLQHAISVALGNKQRCVLVVHGRGKGSFDRKPAIKTHVNQWLRNTDTVLAFHSALPQHGGTGAVYVLLKRQRD